MPQANRSRGWCFTVNNPTEYYEELVLGDLRIDTPWQYIVYGRERGERGTPHLQGYVYFANKKSFDQVKEILGSQAHVEKQRGPTQRAIEYCKKDGDYTEWGEAPLGPAGQADKWKTVISLARTGSMQEIEDRYPAIFLRYHTKLQGLFRAERPIILDVLENEWWFGPTGTGKSRQLWNHYPQHFQKSLNKWWDGYANEDIVAIEEWSPKNEVTASFLKIWSDRYPFTAEIKGGSLQKIRPKKIIILSNYSIEECFIHEQDRGPIKRRFKVVQFHSL